MIQFVQTLDDLLRIFLIKVLWLKCILNILQYVINVQVLAKLFAEECLVQNLDPSQGLLALLLHLFGCIDFVEHISDEVLLYETLFDMLLNRAFFFHWLKHFVDVITIVLLDQNHFVSGETDVFLIVSGDFYQFIFIVVDLHRDFGDADDNVLLWLDEHFSELFLN